MFNMSGWKTWSGGGIFILVGFGGLCIELANAIATNDFGGLSIEKYTGLIGFGLSTWGIGHKVEKAGIMDKPKKVTIKKTELEGMLRKMVEAINIESQRGENRNV